MSAMLPMAVFGLEVPPGDIPITGRSGVSAAFRITMAAIDPSAEPEGEAGDIPRATLKILRSSLFDMDDDDDEDSDDFDADEFEREMLHARSDEDEEEDSDDEDAAGPSDKKARTQRAIAKLLSAKDDMDLDEEDDDDEVPNGVNGTKKSAKALGKMPIDDLDEDEDDDDDDEDGLEFEELVVCTLDPTKNFQQPLDITVGDDERVLFKVSGTHSIFLTGNYVIPANDDGPEYDSDDEEMDYDLEPDSDELDEDDEEDELDDLENPRITELEEEDDEVPTLIKAETKTNKKGKNKRPADDEDDVAAGTGLDELITAAATAKDAAANGEPKLTKAQRKKLKKNDGTSAAAAVTATVKIEPAAVGDDTPGSAKKKVEFAKNLEQGPTPSKDDKKQQSTPEAAKGKATLGIKTVQGVKIDDKKLGTGPAAKNGDRVSMRYIGKLEKDGKVFDSNKKGPPFSFKLGSGEVIKGWDIGIAGMSAGSERRITIPANLAYGSQGAPPDIPKNASLVFDVKLLTIGGKK